MESRSASTEPPTAPPPPSPASPLRTSTRRTRDSSSSSASASEAAEGAVSSPRGSGPVVGRPTLRHRRRRRGVGRASRRPSLAVAAVAASASFLLLIALPPSSAPPPPPCADLNPNCQAWAAADECRKSRDYMTSNCPHSCDLCNPSVRETDRGVEQRVDFDEYFVGGGDDGGGSRADGGAGGENDGGWSAPPAGGGVGVGGDDSGSNDSVGYRVGPKVPSELTRRVKSILRSMDAYLASSPRRPGTRIVPEMCKNRHPHCALWASRGYCELRRRAMRETCSPACHLCHVVTIHDAEDDDGTTGGSDDDDGGDGPTTAAEEGKEMKDGKLVGTFVSHLTTPFQRMDLEGIFEAMEEDRVVIHPSAAQGTSVRSINGSPVGAASFGAASGAVAGGGGNAEGVGAVGGAAGGTTTSAQPNKDQIFVLPLGQIKTHVYGPKPGSDAERSSAAARRRRRPSADDGDDGIGDRRYMNETIESLDGNARVALFENFLSPEECRHLLDLIRPSKMASYKTNAPLGDDGFAIDASTDREAMPPPVKEAVASSKGRVVRRSSRVFLDPTVHDVAAASTGGGPAVGGGGGRVFQPVMERLLSKIEMVTSVPASRHVEVPAQYERFREGDFSVASTHFADAPMFKLREEDEEEDRAGRKGSLDDEDGGAGGGMLDDLLKEAESDLRQMQEMLEAAQGTLKQLEVLAKDGGTATAGEGGAVIRTGPPKTGKNPRIFGITIFLSDVGGEGGGELVFPNMGRFTVRPKLGRAVLYPTVLSLVGEEEEEGAESDAKEENARSHRGGVGAGGHLVEDLGTVMAHAPVKGGVKYTLTLYLRRYPYDNANRLEQLT